MIIFLSFIVLMWCIKLVNSHIEISWWLASGSKVAVYPSKIEALSLNPSTTKKKKKEKRKISWYKRISLITKISLITLCTLKKCAAEFTLLMFYGWFLYLCPSGTLVYSFILLGCLILVSRWCWPNRRFFKVSFLSIPWNS
jgi:hypothetical protein